MKWKKLAWVKKSLGIDKTRYGRGYGYDETLPVKQYSFSSANTNASQVKGYDYLIPESRSDMTDTLDFTVDGIKVQQVMTDTKIYQLRLNNAVATFNVGTFIDGLIKSKDNKKDENGVVILPDSALTLTRDLPDYKITFRIKRVDITEEDKQVHLQYFNADYLIKKK